MTGVFAHVAWDGAAGGHVSPNQALGYWGDASAVWTEPGVTMEARWRSRGARGRFDPLVVSEQESLVVAADVRLDDTTEIPPLQSESGTSDPWQVAAAFRRWGPDAPKNLLGDFAFVVWDRRARTLFCARDHMGVRPLYYAKTSRALVVASDIRSVLATPGIRSEVDWSFLSNLVQERGDTTLTFDATAYEGVFRLPPATSLVAVGGNIRLHRYWRASDAPRVRRRSEHEYVDELRSLIGQAVRCRTREDATFGAHVSGGLDSSCVAALAGRELRPRGRALVGFSWTPANVDGGPDDDRKLVDAVARHEGIPVEFSDVTMADVAETRLRNMALFPTAGYYREGAVRRGLAARGVQVMLSGWGGDETISFNGRGYWAELFRKGRWLALRNEIRARESLFGRSDNKGTWRMFKRGVLPLWIPDAILRRYRPEFAPVPTAIPEGVKPEAAERLRRAGRPLPRYKERAGVRSTQLEQLASAFVPARLEAWASNAEPYGFEYRFPLLDRRLVEFSLGLPSEMFMRNGWDRWLFREASMGIVPDSVAWNKEKTDIAMIRDNDLINETWRRAATKAILDLTDTRSDLEVMDRSRLEYIHAGQEEVGKRYQAARMAAALALELIVNPNLGRALRQRFLDPARP